MKAMNFAALLDEFPREEMEKKIFSKTKGQVEEALSRAGQGSVDDFIALVSPAAEPFLEEMAKISFDLTRKRFGNNVNLFAPVYLSNECNNICTYCGFSYNNPLVRKTLNQVEMLKEIKALKKMGFDNVILLTGENAKRVGVPYFEEAVPLFKEHFSFVALEVQPLDEDDYAKLISLGLDAVLVYQETYDREKYKVFHPRGKKANFDYRLATPERLGNQKITKIGLGVLLGLDDWRVDSVFCAMHFNALKKKYWQTQFSISFPRLRPASKVQDEYETVTEKNLLQLIFAYRLLDEDLDLSLSTRESERFRDAVVAFGITSMSAGSKTNPGGYACAKESLKQFEISDERSPQEIVEMLKTKNLESVWKDWDREFLPKTKANANMNEVLS